MVQYSPGLYTNASSESIYRRSKFVILGAQFGNNLRNRTGRALVQGHGSAIFVGAVHNQQKTAGCQEGLEEWQIGKVARRAAAHEWRERWEARQDAVGAIEKEGILAQLAQSSNVRRSGVRPRSKNPC